jgi:hypothetical protein
MEMISLLATLWAAALFPCCLLGSFLQACLLVAYKLSTFAFK